MVHRNVNGTQKEKESALNTATQKKKWNEKLQNIFLKDNSEKLSTIVHSLKGILRTRHVSQLLYLLFRTELNTL